MIKRITIFIVIFLLFSFNVSAQETETYSELYEQSGASSLQNALPEDVKELLYQNGIDLSSPDWVNEFSAQSVFTHIIKLITDGLSTPLRSAAAAIGIILISAAFPALADNGKNFEPARQAAAIAVALTVALPIWNSISAACSAIKACSTFMLSFIPVFAAIVAASGGAVTAVSMSALLLGAAETVASIASFGILPVMGGYLAVSLCASISPFELSGVCESIKKVAFWALSLVSTLFVGILGIQTAVNSAADSLALKTTRFILGTSVPVAGAALSEAVGTLNASMGLLRSSTGIYGVIALAAIFLPILIELILWRIMLTLCSLTAGIFSQGTVTKILQAADCMLSVLVGILLLVGAMFIISLSIVVGGVK